MSDNRRISRYRAISYVGRAKYGQDWIGSLTPKEKDIIAEYGDGCASKPSSIMPAMFTYTTDGAFRGGAPYYGNSEVANEIDRARHRNRLIDRQYQWAREWLEDHDFDLVADDFSFDEFYQKLKKEFPRVRLRSANAGDLQALSRPPLSAQTALVPALDANPSTQLGSHELRVLDRPLGEQKALIPAPDTSLASQLAGSAPQRVKGTRGPTPGEVRRFDDKDRALFPELKQLMDGGMSLSGAALTLAQGGKVDGTGASMLESRAKRLAALYDAENSLKLAETR